MGRFRRVGEVVYGLAVLGAATLSAGIIGTALALPWVWLPRGARERRTSLAGQVFGRTVVQGLLGARAVVQGRVDLPAGQGALVLCNHRSWLDPPLLLGWTRSNGLAKREILFLPVIGFYGWLTGAVFFARGSAAARTAAREDVLTLIRAGCRVHVYPEGTRSRDGRLRSTVYLRLVSDCHAAGLPVVPCAVWGTERALPTQRRGAVPFQRVYLAIGPTMWPAEQGDPERFAEACWGAVGRLAERLAASDAAGAL